MTNQHKLQSGFMLWKKWSMHKIEHGANELKLLYTRKKYYSLLNYINQHNWAKKIIWVLQLKYSSF